MFSLVIPGNPWPKRRPRISRPAAGRPPRTHQHPEDRNAEQYTREALITAGAPLFTGNVQLKVTFYRASRQVVDLDNLEKHLLDAANGVLWRDDCQVTSKVSRLELDREFPRTWLLVTRDRNTTMLRGSDTGP